ncbi:hypothetical protein HXY33_02565 [Candidatus Bathyarchaeota archaeon]|nr:hypothetical protein [Candidatus Bathyarchaeota archaeon]
MREVAKKVKLLEPIDINSIGIHRDHYFPKAYIIDLPLDSLPDHVWLYIFEREWKASRHLWDRKLFVMGDKLRLVTTEYEIEEKIDWVRQVLERANAGIDEYNKEAEARVAQIEEEVSKQAEEEKARTEAIRDVIRRRFGAF